MPVCLLHSGNSQLAISDTDRVHVQQLELGGTDLHPHKWSHAISKSFLLLLFFFFFSMASKSFLLSKSRRSTCDSMLLDLVFLFPPLRPSLIKKRSMVTADIIAGCVYILCRRGIAAVHSLEIRHPTSAWFTRTKLPPT